MDLTTYTTSNGSPDPLGQIVAQLLAIWIVINGMAIMIGALQGDPMKSVRNLNRWGFRAIRKLIGGALKTLGNFISGKK